jgi:hypothetical protein
MYERFNQQLSIDGFNQKSGYELRRDNKWVILADLLPWNALEAVYEKAFPSKLGRPGTPFRRLFGAHLIRQDQKLSDRTVVTAILDVPAYQYFTGYDKAPTEAPFGGGVLARFRQRITPLMPEIERVMTEWMKPLLADELSDAGVLILDATASPVQIKYPQDIVLLGQTRKHLEKLIDTIYKDQLDLDKPRTYRREAQKIYNAFIKKPGRTSQATRKAVSQQLNYIKRDIRYIQEGLDQGAELNEKAQLTWDIANLIFEQQQYMYVNRTHKVADRIVSFTQPNIRGIIRGKAASKIEFGPKYDISTQDGLVELERLSFDPYNEASTLEQAVERYYDTHGEYPEKVLADKLYRTKANQDYLAELGIKLLGPKRGRPRKNISAEEKAAAYQAEVDRIKIERKIALLKVQKGLGLVREKTVQSIETAIHTAIITLNLDKVVEVFLPDFSVWAENESEVSLFTIGK